MKVWKIVLALFVGLPVALVIVAVAFVLTLDPNRLKPLMIDTAAEQGYRLQLTGDLSWRFFPELGVSLGAAQIFQEGQSEPLLALQSAELAVAVKPLLERRIEVVGVAVDGAKVVFVNKKANAPEEPEVNEPEAVPGTSTDLPEFHIDKIRLSDLALTYIDGGETTRVTGINLSAEGVNWQGGVFPLQLSADLETAGLNVSVHSQGGVAFDLKQQSLTLDQQKLELLVAGQPVSASVSAQVSLAPELAVKADVSAQVAHLRTLLTALDIVLPETQKAGRFGAVALDTHLNYVGEQLDISKLTLTLDETELSGELAITLAETPRVKAALMVGELNVDEYLPPATSEETASASPASQPSPEPEPLPLALLTALDADVTLAIRELRAAGIPVSDIALAAKVGGGEARLELNSATVAEGKVTASTVLDGKMQTALLKGELDTQGIQLQRLLALLEQEPVLAGALNSQLTFSGRGATDRELIDSIAADIRADAPHIQLKPINIEQLFCQGVKMLSGDLQALTQNEESGDWPQYTELQPITVKARYQGSKVVLEKLTADIQKLSAMSYGELDLASGDFRFPLDVQLADFAAGLESCVEVDQSWRERTVPLRCRGNLADIGAKTCLPDVARIRSGLQDKAEQKAKKELARAQKKAEEKAKKEAERAAKKAEDKAKELLDQHVDEDDVEAIKDSLKGLFGR